jgi:hypothetical protein
VLSPVCKSKWARSTDLCSWYLSVHKDFVEIKLAHDRSGQHDFGWDGLYDVSSEGFREICDSFITERKLPSTLLHLHCFVERATLTFLRQGCLRA